MIGRFKKQVSHVNKEKQIGETWTVEQFSQLRDEGEDEDYRR